jgi:hypothetical protein
MSVSVPCRRFQNIHLWSATFRRCDGQEKQLEPTFSTTEASNHRTLYFSFSPLALSLVSRLERGLLVDKPCNKGERERSNAFGASLYRPVLQYTVFIFALCALV